MGALSRRQDDFQWFKWYPGMWLSDNGLRMCSDEARGIWIDMLCRMWFSNVRGVLPGDIRSLARIIGKTDEVMTSVVADLERCHVFSRGAKVCPSLPEDAIVNRRMYRDWQLSKSRAEAGRKGGEAGLGVPRSARKATKSKTPKNGSKDEAKKHKTNPSDSTGYDSESKANFQQRSNLIRIQNSEVRNKFAEERGRAREISSTGDVLGASFGFGVFKSELLTRIQTATGDDAAWMAWWRVAIPVLAEYDALGELEDEVKHVEDCLDPVARRAKDLGALKHPGRYLVSRVLAMARKRGARLPDLPSVVAAAEDGTR